MKPWKKDTKQVKWVCPRGCGYFRMLNPRISLALCEKCLVQLVPLVKKNIKGPVKKNSKKDNENQNADGLRCTKCGRYVHILTIVKEGEGKPAGEYCYDCAR